MEPKDWRRECRRRDELAERELKLIDLSARRFDCAFVGLLDSVFVQTTEEAVTHP